jgi:regulatory protein SWI6
LALLIFSVALTAALGNLANQHSAEMRLKTEQIDRATNQIREFASQHAIMEAHISQLAARLKRRGDRGTRIHNLRRSIQDRRKGALERSLDVASNSNMRAGDVEKLEKLDIPATSVPSTSQPPTSESLSPSLNTIIDPNALPDLPTLRARLAAYQENNGALRATSRQLKGRSAEVEAMYRKVISLCTRTPEQLVDETLPAMVQALESEGTLIGGTAAVNGAVSTPVSTGAGRFSGDKEKEQEVKRIGDFLKKVDGLGTVA